MMEHHGHTNSAVEETTLLMLTVEPSEIPTAFTVGGLQPLGNTGEYLENTFKKPPIVNSL